MANVFDLQAKIGLNTEDFKKGLANAGNAMKGIATGIGNMVKVGVAGFSAVSAGVGALTKQAVTAYADYEQLTGGVETLFGAGGRSLEEYAASVGKAVDECTDDYNKLMAAQSTVMENAANAYKTAGLSANEYMETVTSFSASLIASLNGDTEAAAVKADMAITDMADNANKMGSSMESIQNAYSGFAKQNYTMLDNLKLGYGGTASEMERLIEDAEKADDSFKASRDENGKLVMSYGEVVDAIHIIQGKLDITGTTAKEAASTISGSLGMVKSAWANLITGVADDEADFDTLVNNFVDSVDTVAGNIMPRIEVALGGAGKLIEKLVPIIIEKVPSLLEQVMPSLISAAGSLISIMGSALIDNADKLLGYVSELLNKVLVKLVGTSLLSDGVKQLIETLTTSIPEIFSQITDIGIQIIKKLAEVISDKECMTMILNSFAQMLNDVILSADILLPIMLDMGYNLITQVAQSVLDNLPMLIETAMYLVQDFAEWIAENAPIMIPQIVSLISQLALMLTDPQNISTIVDASITIINAITDGMINALPILLENAPIIIQNLVDAFTENFPKILDCAWQLIKTLTNALLVNLPLIIESGKKIIDSLMVGIIQAEMQLWDKIKEIRETMHERFKEMIDFAKTWGKDLIDNFIGGIKEKISKLKDTVSDVAQSVKDFLGFSEPKTGPLSNFHTYAPDMMALFTDGIKENTSMVTNQLDKSLDNVVKAFDISPEISPISVDTDKLDKSLSAVNKGTDNSVNNYYITVSSGTISSDYDARRAAQIMSEELGTLKNMERMAVGG